MKKVSEGDIRLELGDPVPFGHDKRRHLLIAAALGAPLGTRDLADLTLLSAASRKEDLRHYQQLAHTPLTPERRRSIAHIRKTGTTEEVLYARGEMEAVLELCNPDQATRYRAETDADMEAVRGFRALALAQGSPGADGRESWRFLGYIPIRALRHKVPRSEEPESFRYVPVWDWQLRVLHWTVVLLIILLSATGILMGTGRFIYDGTRGYSNYFSYLRLIHFTAGWLFLCCAILRVAGLFLASNRFQRWNALFPVRRRDLGNLVQVMENYLFCRFDRGPHYIAHNPLQQVAYTAIYIIGLYALLTGFALYALYAPDHPLFQYLVRLDQLVGVPYLRLIHLLIMWIFMAFIPIHVYLSIRADTIEREGAISSIISGGRWCRKGAAFEDDAPASEAVATVEEKGRSGVKSA